MSLLFQCVQNFDLVLYNVKIFNASVIFFSVKNPQHISPNSRGLKVSGLPLVNKHLHFNLLHFQSYNSSMENKVNKKDQATYSCYDKAKNQIMS